MIFRQLFEPVSSTLPPAHGYLHRRVSSREYCGRMAEGPQG